MMFLVFREKSIIEEITTTIHLKMSTLLWIHFVILFHMAQYVILVFRDKSILNQTTIIQKKKQVHFEVALWSTYLWHSWKYFHKINI